jgi:dTDP-4-dehydrorhamnose 3,5-epimerase
LTFSETTLPGVLRIAPQVYGDSRGFFLESYRRELFTQRGIPDFVQDNHSRSVRNTLRGLHFQHPHGQGKLIRVVSGTVYDVLVDVRLGSPTFGEWEGYELSAENHHMLYVPPGFAHGFCVLSDSADFIYKCTAYYHRDSEQTLLWNDPALAIEWPVREPILSEKDRNGLPLKELSRFPEYLEGM